MLPGMALAAVACLQPNRLATPAERIVAAARDQLTWGTKYDPSYVKLSYPGGDVPRKQGVCTDVVIRALRSIGHDLQSLIHVDKVRRPAAYRTYSGQKGPDRNIDHRRCPNQRTYFRRYGKTLGIAVNASTIKDWQPGDIVFWKLPSGLDHVGILTDRRSADGVPWAIHNLSTPLEEPVLTAWTIVAHFRYPASATRTRPAPGTHRP